MKKIANFYNKLEANLLVASLAFTVVVIFLQVIMRYVFNNSLSWSEELARYIFIWQIWLGASLSMKENSHISVDILPSRMKGKYVVYLIANLIMIAFSIFMVKYGWSVVVSMMSRGLKSTALRIPMYIIYLTIPFSHFVISLRLLFRIKKDIIALVSLTTIGEENGGVE